MNQSYSAFELVIYAIIGANVLFSYTAFNKPALFENYKFNIGRILANKEYLRLITSGFLHVNLGHLVFNMIAFWSFALVLDRFIDVWQFVFLYAFSLVIGNLLPLYIHRNNSHYSAVGASGAVSGVVFASILFFPYGKIIIIFLPFLPIPSWVFGILYLFYTVYAMGRNNDNIGHEAHLGGALAGLAAAVLFRPDMAAGNWWLVLVLFLIPFAMLFYKPRKS
jgi:membrane associated rhomboid family serine protease